MNKILNFHVTEYVLPITMLLTGISLYVWYSLQSESRSFEIFIFTNPIALVGIYLWVKSIIFDSLRIYFKYPQQIPGFIYSANILFFGIFAFFLSKLTTFEFAGYDPLQNIFIWFILEILLTIAVGKFIYFNNNTSRELGVLIDFLRFIAGYLVFFAFDLVTTLIMNT